MTFGKCLDVLSSVVKDPENQVKSYINMCSHTCVHIVVYSSFICNSQSNPEFFSE